MKRVAIVTPTFGKRGGVERVAYELARRLSEKFHVTVVTGDIEPGIELDGVITEHSYILHNPEFLKTLSFSLGNRSRLCRLRFDLVHSFGTAAFDADIISAASCHKFWFRHSLTKIRPLTRPWILKILNPVHFVTIAIEQIQYQGSSLKLILACSKITAKEVASEYNLPSSRITVIPNGVDTEEFHPRNRAEPAVSVLRESFSVRQDEIILLFAAHEFSRKGLTSLLRALPLVKVPLKLIIVGRDDPRRYQKLIKNLGVEHQVVFTGARSDMAALYALADIFVFPTTYEAFGLVIIEAMASGACVITSACAGAAELIEHGKSGLLLCNPQSSTEIANAIQKLLKADVRTLMSRHGRNAVLKVSWDRIAEDTAAMYESCLQVN